MRKKFKELEHISFFNSEAVLYWGLLGGTKELIADAL